MCCALVSVADNILLLLGDGVRRLNCPPVRADDPYSMISSGRGFLWSSVFFEIIGAVLILRF